MSQILTTPRLVLRLMEPGDEASLESLDGDPRVRAFFPGGTASRPASRRRIADSRESFARDGFCECIVESEATGEFMGRAGLKRFETGEVEAGYLFLPRFWSQGFATEALLAVLAWHPGLRVIAFAPLEHRASHRVMEKAGMSWFKDEPALGVPCKFYQTAKPGE